jgi:hypothetical protein
VNAVSCLEHVLQQLVLGDLTGVLDLVRFDVA